MGVRDSETVSGHMYRMAMMCWVVQDAELDSTKCIKMALVHDLAEALVGDITPHCGISKAEKAQREMHAMTAICDTLRPSPIADEILALFLEYEAGETRTARLLKDLDKLDMVLQASEYEGAQGVSLTPFFTSTQGCIQHPQVQAWDSLIRNQRQQAHTEATTTTTSTSPSTSPSKTL
jgi:putative hydrolases of HD superfamily